MSELLELRRRVAELERQLHDSGEIVTALTRSELDSVAAEGIETPILLHDAQEKLRASEQLLRAIFDGALEPMVLTDVEGRYVDANPAACALYGLTLEQLVGRNYAEFTGPELASGAAHETFRNEGHRRGRFALDRSNGSRRILEYSSVSNVAPGLDLSVLRDVTDRIAAEDALRRSEALFRAVIEKSAEIISLTAGDGTTRYLTPSAWRSLGWKSDEVGSRTMRDQVIPEDRARIAAELERMVRTGARDMAMDLRVRHRDGSIRWFESTGTNLLDDPDVAAIVGNYRDITARKVAEEALRTSRDLLERAQAMAHLGSWTSGVGEDDELHWTPECGRIFDMAEGAVITLGQIMTRVHPDDRERVMSARHKAAEARAPLDIEHRIVRDDGRLCWVHARTSVERWNGVLRMVAVVQDITDRKLADAALRESEERYRRIVENTSEGIWTYDPQGITTFVNGRMAEMLGCSAEEALGQSIYEFTDESDLAAAKDRLSRLEQGASEGGEFRLRRKDGTNLWTSVQANPFLGSDGRFEGALVLVTDITAQRRADEVRAQLAAIVESSEDAILSAAVDGTIVTWNPGAERLFQYSAEEAIGRHLTLLRAPDVAADQQGLLDRVAEGSGIHYHEAQRRRKDGTLVEVAISVSPIRDANGKVLGGSAIIRDLTARRKTEAALRHTEEQFRQAQKMEAVGRLAGGVAHDFNNLLSVILSYANLAADELKEGDPLRGDLLEVRKAGERATALTRQLLAFSRQQVLQPRVIDLNEIVDGMKSMLGRLLGEDVELAVRADGRLGRVLADPGQIEQVVMNLAVNARDAMPQGGKLTIETTNVELDAVYVSAHLGVAAGHYVMLAVSDTGTGMDAATRTRIFEPFFTTKEKGKGTGLGLSTVFGIAEQSGGHVAVYSELGQGSTFKVYLPRTDRVADVAHGATTAARLRGTETILLVEDEEQVRVVACAILRRNGYEVLESANGGEALLIAKSFEATIHLLLTDVVMPRMSGRLLVEQLAPERPDMKVLFASGYTDDAIVRHGVLDEGVAFLQKPFTPDMLLRRVREVLDN